MERELWIIYPNLQSLFFIHNMKKVITFIFFLLCLYSVGFAQEKIDSDCMYVYTDGNKIKKIPLHGKVKIVTSFPDIKVQIVESFSDLDVKLVESFPDNCGEWQIVDSFEDFSIQIVTSFPDIKITYVTSFPGKK